MEWIVHVEGDFGGRIPSYYGIYKGLPYLCKLFDHYKIRPTFLVNTSCINSYTFDMVLKHFPCYGRVGSHGHDHQYKDFETDYIRSWAVLEEFKLGKRSGPYCAPKFKQVLADDKYSDPKGQVSILKLTWGLQQVNGKSWAVYMHPFDFIKPMTKAPNLYCRILYSRWQKVRETLENLLNQSAKH